MKQFAAVCLMAAATQGVHLSEALHQELDVQDIVHVIEQVAGGFQEIAQGNYAIGEHQIEEIIEEKVAVDEVIFAAADVETYQVISQVTEEPELALQEVAAVYSQSAEAAGIVAEITEVKVEEVVNVHEAAFEANNVVEEGLIHDIIVVAKTGGNLVELIEEARLPFAVDVPVYDEPEYEYSEPEYSEHEFSEPEYDEPESIYYDEALDEVYVVDEVVKSNPEFDGFLASLLNQFDALKVSPEGPAKPDTPDSPIRLDDIHNTENFSDLSSYTNGADQYDSLDYLTPSADQYDSLNNLTPDRPVNFSVKPLRPDPISVKPERPVNFGAKPNRPGVLRHTVNYSEDSYSEEEGYDFGNEDDSRKPTRNVYRPQASRGPRSYHHITRDIEEYGANRHEAPVQIEDEDVKGIEEEVTNNFTDIDEITGADFHHDGYRGGRNVQPLKEYNGPNIFNRGSQGPRDTPHGMRPSYHEGPRDDGNYGRPQGPSQRSKDGETRYEAPRHEAPSRREAPRREAPRHEAPRHEGPRYEAPRHEAPRHEAPRYEAPRHEAPRHEAPSHHRGPRYEDVDNRYERSGKQFSVDQPTMGGRYNQPWM